MKLLILFLLLSINGLGKTETKKNPYAIPGMTANKDELLKFLREESPKQFCDEKGYFIKCFDIVESQCPEETQTSFDGCKQSVIVPEKFDVLEIEDYSAKLGECVGIDLEKKWTERKRGSRECKKRF